MFKGLLTVSATILASTTLYANEKKPNVILINADDLGYIDVGFNRSKYYDTPNIDRLAANSVIFDNSYACAANCAPSRVSMFSGLNTPKHGVYTVGTSRHGKEEQRRSIPVENTPFLGENFPNMAKMFKDAGYATINIGKFHIGEVPQKYGFDENIAGSRMGQPGSYFSPYKTPNIKNGEDGEHMPYRLTSEAISFIERNQDRPYFLYLPYFSIHTPLQGKKELIDKYSKDDRLTRKVQYTYAAMLESLDYNIGRLYDYLEEHDAFKNTIIIFTSDNGGISYFSSQAPFRAGKGSYYEGGVRVPMTIRYDKLNHGKGERLSANVSQLDFLPTLAKLTNIKIDNSKFDGIDISDYIINPEKDHEVKNRYIYYHFPVYLITYGTKNDVPLSMQCRDREFRTRPGSAIIHNNWKLIKYYEDDNDFELFNLDTDISEQNNLAPTHQAKKEELQKKLEDYLISVNAKLPIKK